MSKTKNPKVTIKEVARQAGVSIATVSRVMHGNYYVSPEICQRVQEIVEQLKYLPDSNAASLKSKYRRMIGYLVSDISNYQFTAINRAVEDVLESRGFSLIVCSNDSRGERERNYLNTLLSHRIDGLIINTSGKNDKLIAEISEGLPVVLLYRTISSFGFQGDFVGSSDYKGGKLMAKALLARGHRRVALISGDLSFNTFGDRYKGFIDGLAETGQSVPREWILTDEYTEAGGFTMMQKLLGDALEIDAVCVLNNAMAVGVYNCLRKNNIAVPEQIAVVSFGDIYNDQLFYVKPAFISQHPQSIGSAAADLLLSRIENSSLKPRKKIIPVKLALGESI
ncbi:LacI family transcriptional regulator [Betaproteobacteria bacterium]|nr:LacI family transcriptional regulator [Betaproteobacteria bacterium]